jgi:hypothetical protein
LLRVLHALQFQFTTLMVVDDYHRGIPIAFFIHSAESEDAAFRPALERFKEVMLAEQADWAPSTFVVDDCTAANNAIE